MSIWMLYSCSDDNTVTNAEPLSESWKIIEMDSSNEGGGNDSDDLLNDSFRQ